MSDHLNKKVLLVGASQMAVDYFNVLRALRCDLTVVGRGSASADAFEQKTGHRPFTGGIDAWLAEGHAGYDAAIVAVGVEQLAPVSMQLIRRGFREILVEKPAGLNDREIREFASVAEEHNANVYVAYNRRFYASVLKAQELIRAEGGALSFHFEFTEWPHEIEALDKKPGIKENWFMVNSSHIVDMAFFMGGQPAEMKNYTGDKLSWHDPAIFAGAGRTKNHALFSYLANWAAPGRWNVEIMTKKSRLIFRPIEELSIQLHGSVAINKVEADYSLDKQFKPGLYLQTLHFLTGKTGEMKTIHDQVEMLDTFTRISKGS